MNICRNFVFRKILKEVRPVELRGEAFPTLFFHIVVGGFHESGNSVWRSGLGFWPVSSSFFVFFLIGESSTSWISRALECRPQKWLVKIVPPTFGKYFFSGILVIKSRGTLRWNKTHHLRLEVIVSGVYLVVGTKFITPRKVYLGAGENWTFSVARTILVQQSCCVQLFSL